jgi:hypothetical protein
MTQSPPTLKPQDASAGERAPALWWYGLGCALLGFLIGITAGLSESPIVAVLVPLLFALLSGGGGFYVAKADLSKPEEKGRMATLGKLLSVFSVLALIGALYGALIRTGASVVSLIPGFETRVSTVQTTDYSTLTVDEALQISALKLRLELLRVPPEQIKKTIEVARQEFERGGTSQPELARVISDIRLAATKAKNLLPNTADPNADSRFADLDQLTQNLTEIEQRYFYLQTLIQRSAHVDVPKLLMKLKDDSRVISEFIYGKKTHLQTKYPELFQAIVELKTGLDLPFINLEATEWLYNPDFLEELDRAVKLVSTKEGAGTSEAEVERPTMKSQRRRSE